MSEEIAKHDVTAPPQGDIQTVEEFDALIEKLKIQSPLSYQIQLENGELERFRKTLRGAEAAEEKPRRGRPRKEAAEEASAEEPEEEKEPE